MEPILRDSGDLIVTIYAAGTDETDVPIPAWYSIDDVIDAVVYHIDAYRAIHGS